MLLAAVGLANALDQVADQVVDVLGVEHLLERRPGLQGRAHALCRAGLHDEHLVPIEGVGRERLVYAAGVGRFVAAGEPIGRLDETPILAPITGTLRGIVRSGVDVPARAKLLEVDPRPLECAVFAGLAERLRRIAEGVLTAIRGA